MAELTTAPAPQVEPEVVISKDWYTEFVATLRAKTAMAMGAWELGVRLREWRSSKQFLKVEVLGKKPRDWHHFITSFVDISPDTAERTMAAATFTRKNVARFGVERLYWLRKITELTLVDETPEQAIALVLPLADGGTKPFEDMTADEVEAAYELMRNGGRGVERTASPEAAAGQVAADADRLAAARAHTEQRPDQAQARAEAPANDSAPNAGVAKAPSKPATRDDVKPDSEDAQALKARTTQVLAPIMTEDLIEVRERQKKLFLEFRWMPFDELEAIGKRFIELARWRPGN